MDLKMHLCIYVFMLVNVMDAIEGLDNEYAHGMRPEDNNAYIFKLEPEQKHDMYVEMNRLGPNEDNSKTNSNSGFKTGSIVHPKGTLRVIVEPSKVQSIQKSEDLTFFPIVKFNFLRTSINEESDIFRSNIIGFHRPEGISFKSYRKRKSLSGNLTPNRRLASMIGYLGDMSKVEQQLTMGSGLVAEENPMLGSLIGKSYSSHKTDDLTSSINKIMTLKYNRVGSGRDLLDHTSVRYYVPETVKKVGFNIHKHLDVVPQKKVISFSRIFPRSDIPLESNVKDIQRSLEGISLNVEKARSHRAVENLRRLLGNADVTVNKDRAKRASIDLTNLLPPITLEIGKSAYRSESSESTEGTSENERSGFKLDQTQSKRSTEKLSRLLGSVDVTVNKGRGKRASIDLNNLLPPISLEIGKSAPKSENPEGKVHKEMGRSRRASVDLSGILPTTNLQVGKSERSIADLETTRFSPLIVLFSNTKVDSASDDAPYLLSLVRSFLRKLVKWDDDYFTDDDSALSRQTPKIQINNK